MYIMLAVTGQTAGPNWLKVFEETSGVTWAKKYDFFRIRNFFQVFLKFYGQRLSASYI